MAAMVSVGAVCSVIDRYQCRAAALHALADRAGWVPGGIPRVFPVNKSSEFIRLAKEPRIKYLKTRDLFSSV